MSASAATAGLVAPPPARKEETPDGRQNAGLTDKASWPSLPGNAQADPINHDLCRPRSLQQARVSTWQIENRIIYGMVSATAALSVVAYVLHFLGPCPFDRLAFDPSCRQMAAIIHWVGIAKYTFAVCPFSALVVLKCFRILRLQQHRPWLQWLPWLPKVTGPLPSSHWAMVATHSFYAESAQSIKALHLLVVLVQTPSVIFTCQQVVEGIGLYLDGFQDSPDCQDGRFDTLRCQGRIWRFLAIQAAWTLWIIPTCLLIVTPDMAWAPASQQAAARLGDVYIQKLALLPWLVAAMLPILAVNTFLFWCVLWDETAEDRGVVVVVHFAVCLLATGLGLATLFWSKILQNSLTSLLQWCNSVCCCSGCFHQGSVGLSASEEEPGTLSGDIEKRYLAKSTAWDITRHDFHRVIGVQASYLLASFAGISMANVAVFIALRVAVLALFLAARESESTFASMQTKDAALGLVMDAKALARALTAVIEGKQWRGHIPSYRATILRMERTLAVSYKWQEKELPLNGEGQSLNMSAFQIQTLISAIKVTGYNYVWVDRLSVPTHPSRLQATLLSRMLIVYASSGATLAVRTKAEQPQLRYHRRAWTFQEFCCAPKLYVETEGPVSWSTCGSIIDAAVTLEEERFFCELRPVLQHSLRSCQPIWLCSLEEHLVTEKATQIVGLYKSLAPLLFCENGADKLRALCPLLSSTLVEGLDEMLLLIGHLKSKADTTFLDELGEELLAIRKASSHPAELQPDRSNGLFHSHPQVLITPKRSQCRVHPAQSDIECGLTP